MADYPHICRTRSIIEALLNDQITNGNECINEKDGFVQEIILYARHVAVKVRNLDEYKLLLTDLEPDEYWLLTPSRIDTLLNILFKYSQSAGERINRTCVFLTFIADVCKDVNDSKSKEEMIRNMVDLTLRRLNSDDFDVFYKEQRYL